MEVDRGSCVSQDRHATQNRSVTTNSSCVREERAPFHWCTWEAGSQLPPFVNTNTEVVTLLKYLKSIYDGTMLETPIIMLTNAIAVQIWRLVFDTDVRSDLLAHLELRGVWRGSRRWSC